MAVKKYKEFLLEWGFGGSEGGVNQKDPVIVSDRMITDIQVGEYEEDEEDRDIAVLKDLEDIDESVDLALDPYSEEDWEGELVDMDYINCGKPIEEWLRSLNDEYINDLLDKIKDSDREKAEESAEEIVSIIEDTMDLDDDQIRALYRDSDDLYIDKDVDNDEDEGPDPDEWYDRTRLEELEDAGNNHD